MDAKKLIDKVFSKRANNNVGNGGSNSSGGQRLEVLVIDDDEMSRKLITRLVERELSANVQSFSNGIEGLEYAETHHPSLIILDLMLPGMNGYDILKELRNDKKLEDVKVILVSAKSRSEDIERGFDLSADEYITKPFQPKEFLARIRRLTNDH